MTFHGEERTRHPERERLEGFLRGELPRAEARAVVRHLLTGCASCRRITGRLWRLGDEPFPREGGELLMTRLEAAQAQAREAVRALRGIQFSLLGVRASLLSSSGGELREGEPPGPEAELCTAIECVLHDALEPAIGSLEAAAEG
jgi:hypothetical protein